MIKLGAYTIRNIPPKLWREVKILAAREGESIRQLILNALEEKTRR